MMHNAGAPASQFPHNFLRVSSGQQPFATKIQDQENGGSPPRFLCSYQFEQLPLHRIVPLGVPSTRNPSIGASFPSPSIVKPSFSIDSLLGLKDNGRASPMHAALNWNHHFYNQNQQHLYPSHNHSREEESKVKSSLRYTPYKRERKTTGINEVSETKESVSRNGKAKRVRTIFTPEQLEKLESEFERQQYMVGTERSYLAESLDLTEAQVKVWFQNRRIKWRKVHLEMAQERLRALQSQEGREGFEESSESSEEDCSMNQTMSVPTKVENQEGNNNEVVKSSSTLLPPSRQQLDVDEWLLKTFGTLHPVPRWIGENWNSGSEADSE